MPTWQPIGKHRFYIEGMLFLLETKGELTPEEAARLIQEMTEADLRSPALGILVDVAGGFSLPAETRRTIARLSTESHGRPTIPMAVVGASLPVRAVVTLLINAVQLVTRRRNDLRFFALHAEANAWLMPLARKRGEEFPL
jgi:hypothetical protein